MLSILVSITATRSAAELVIMALIFIAAATGWRMALKHYFGKPAFVCHKCQGASEDAGACRECQWRRDRAEMDN